MHLACPGVREIFKTYPGEVKGDAKDVRQSGDMSVESFQSQEECTSSQTEIACEQTEPGRNDQQQLCHALEKFGGTLWLWQRGK